MDLAIKKIPLKPANVCNISKSSCNRSTYAIKCLDFTFDNFSSLYYTRCNLCA